MWLVGEAFLLCLSRVNVHSCVREGSRFSIPWGCLVTPLPSAEKNVLHSLNHFGAFVKNQMMDVI